MSDAKRPREDSGSPHWEGICIERAHQTQRTHQPRHQLTRWVVGIVGVECSLPTPEESISVTRRNLDTESRTALPLPPSLDKGPSRSPGVVIYLVDPQPLAVLKLLRTGELGLVSLTIPVPRLRRPWYWPGRSSWKGSRCRVVNPGAAFWLSIHCFLMYMRLGFLSLQCRC